MTVDVDEQVTPTWWRRVCAIWERAVDDINELITPARRPRVQINYKSGHSMVFECDSFKVTRKATGKEYEWVNAKPNPMIIGVDDVESVWEL